MSDTETPLKILLIEDNPDHADLIRIHLSRGQNLAMQVEWSERLSDGLERISQGGVDAVLLDMMLPDCTGIDTIRRAHAHAPNLPIVVLTSNEGEEHGLEAMHEGAEDYIFKGQMDRHNLTRALRYAVERGARRHAESALEGAKQELKIAQRIQQSLYPKKAPPLDSFEIAGMSIPAESVGGDYFDYFHMLDGHLGVAVGDVSGHGIGPALMMAETRAALRTLAQTSSDTGEILTLANRILSDGMLEGRFITLVLTRLDLVKKQITFASAGHPDCYVFDAEGNIVHKLESMGCPLGILPEEKFVTPPPIQLESGQMILLYTDGIFEASPPGDVKPFGFQRLIDIMIENRELPAEEILPMITAAVEAHCQPGRHLDDVTAVIIKVK